MGAVTPARRSCSASSTVATPSQAAPAARAVAATSTAPWPNASAFTTAMNFASVFDLSSRMFSAITE